MAYSSLAMSSLIFSHILPPILAFIAIILITSGIMDEKNHYTITGIVLFLIAAFSPFVILPFLLAGT
jgi:hypothetical protein